MKTRPLGRTGIAVSELCLGTMTWGSQNTEAEGHEQMDYAVAQGINFVDTAELYPTTPLSAETYGQTEEIIGSWFAARGRRDDIVLATKVTGAGREWIDDGAPLSGERVLRAAERSLKRLRTDYIDLYQLHWPNRHHYHFRQSWDYAPWTDRNDNFHAELDDIMGAMQRLVDDGKVRHIGLSNETAWGTMQYLRAAETKGYPRVASIQNEYSLLHRIFDTDLAEVAVREDVGLMAFSPLTAGFLTGKYRNGAVPPGTRRSMQDTLNGRINPYSEPAADAYFSVAVKHGLDCAQMALAFGLTRPFMTAVIIGATSMQQLKTNVAAAQLTLDDAVLADIAAVHRRYPLTM